MAIIPITPQEYQRKFGTTPAITPTANMPQMQTSAQPKVIHPTISDLKAQEDRAVKDSKKSLFKRFLSALPGAATEVNFGGPARLATSLGEGVTQTFKTGGRTSASGKTYDLPGLAPFKSFQSEADQKAQEGMNPIKNIATTGGKTVLAGLETVGLASGVAKAGKVASAVNNSRNNAKIWNLVQPKLTATSQAQAVKSGQIAKTGLMGKVIQILDDEIVGVARQYLKTTDPLKAVGQMQEGIATEANAIKEGLRQSQAIWNRNELTGALKKIEKPHLLSGDTEKAFVKTLNAALKEAESSPKTLDGLLDVRQKFDRIVKQQYPNLYESDTLTPIKSAVMETRRTINNMIEAKLPESAQKEFFRQSLRKQSLLYEAIDNAATKAPKLGTSSFTKTGKYAKSLGKVGAAGLGIGGGFKILSGGE